MLLLRYVSQTVLVKLFINILVTAVAFSQLLCQLLFTTPQVSQRLIYLYKYFTTLLIRHTCEL